MLLRLEMFDDMFEPTPAPAKKSASKLRRHASQDFEEEHVESSVVALVSKEDMKARAIAWANANGESGQVPLQTQISKTKLFDQPTTTKTFGMYFVFIRFVNFVLFIG